MNVRAERDVNLHFYTEDPELDRVLKPSTAYHAPSDVVHDPALSLFEKKAILAFWASDACALENHPAFRFPPSLAEPVSFDVIMSALQELDHLQSARSIHAGLPANRESSPAC
jgi:hypothetical protein